MYMRNIENGPEQPPATPSEASKGFLKGWGDSNSAALNLDI